MSAALHLLEGARTRAEYLLFLLLVLGENLVKTREESIAQVDDADVFFLGGEEERK